MRHTGVTERPAGLRRELHHGLARHTTEHVVLARREGRRAIGIDVSADSVAITERRLAQQAMVLA